MEFKMIKVEDDASVLKQRNEELEQSIRSLKEENDDLMILNNVLVWEKNKAESDTENWKAKCKELEIEIVKLKKRLSDTPEMYSGGAYNVAGGPGTPPVSTPAEQCLDSEGCKRHLRHEFKSTVRKCLDFASPHNSISDGSNDGFKTKRRRAGEGATVVVSSESETNDNTPIGKLKRHNLLAHSSDSSLKRRSSNSSCFRDKPRKRRLRKVGDREDKGDWKECSSKSTGNQDSIGISENLNDNLGEDENEEDDSSGDGESMGSFIVGSSDASGTGSASNCRDMSTHDSSISGESSSEPKNVSSDSMIYQEVISSYRRERKNKLKWDYEADMLADFAKSPELCMKAVCAIYRQQTAEEQYCKATIDRNGRGFSHAHSESGSYLAEFLTDGDPKGDMNKSVEELKEFDSKGVKKCRKLANCYSKQLFKIYENKEDPFFHP